MWIQINFNYNSPPKNSTEKETMQLQRNDLSAEAVKIIETTPKAELERLLGVEQQKISSIPPSKWAKYAKSAPAPLNGTSAYIMECSKEVRENSSTET